MRDTIGKNIYWIWTRISIYKFLKYTSEGDHHSNTLLIYRK